MGCHPKPIDELHRFSRWLLHHQPSVVDWLDNVLKRFRHCALSSWTRRVQFLNSQRRRRGALACDWTGRLDNKILLTYSASQLQWWAQPVSYTRFHIYTQFHKPQTCGWWVLSSNPMMFSHFPKIATLGHVDGIGFTTLWVSSGSCKETS